MSTAADVVINTKRMVTMVTHHRNLHTRQSPLPEDHKISKISKPRSPIWPSPIQFTGCLVRLKMQVN